MAEYKEHINSTDGETPDDLIEGISGISLLAENFPLMYIREYLYEAARIIKTQDDRIKTLEDDIGAISEALRNIRKDVTTLSKTKMNKRSM